MSEATQLEALPPATAPAVSGRWQHIGWLALVFAVALLIRLTHIDAFPSLDEIWHLGITAGNGSTMSQFTPDTLYVNPPSWSRLEEAKPFWHIWFGGMDGVLHPPLYCLTLRFWRDVFGTSDFAAHLYSIVWSLIAIGFVFDTARRAMDLNVAVLVGLAIACSQTQVYFAQEIRGYQMMIAFAAFALWLMTRVELEGATRLRAVVLAWSTLPLVLTHYFSFGGTLAIAVWGLWRLTGYRVRFLVHLVIAGLLYIACWVPFALAQIDDLNTGDAFLFVEHPSRVEDMLRLLCAPLRPLVDINYKVTHFAPIAGLMLIIPWIRFRQFKPLLPWGIALCVGVLPLLMLDLVRSTIHLDFVRYFSVISPAVFLLIAGCGWTFHRRIAYASTSIAIVVGGWLMLSRVPVIADCPDLQPYAKTLQLRMRPGDALITYPGAGPDTLGEMFLMTALHTPGTLNRPVIVLHKPMTQDILAKMPARAWLFTNGLREPLDEIIPAAKDLPGSFRDEFQYVYLDLSQAGSVKNHPQSTTRTSD